MASRNGKRPKSRRAGKATSNGKVMPALIPQPNGKGALLSGGVPGHKGGSGRPLSITKRLAAEKLPPHVETLDELARGKTVVEIVERCPKCGFEPPELVSVEPVLVKPGERVRAIEALSKLAEGSELVVTSDNARAFFDCVDRAVKEVIDDPSLVEVIHDRAKELFRTTRKAAS